MIRRIAAAFVFVLGFLLLLAEVQRDDESNVPEWSIER